MSTTLPEARESTNLPHSIKPFILTSSYIDSQPFESIPPSTEVWRTLLSSQQTPTNGITAGIAYSAPKTGYLCPHLHQQEEIDYILSGEGYVTINDEETKAGEGSLVYIPGSSKHGIRNADERHESEGGIELKFFWAFPCDGFGDVVYRFDE